ncbi:MAG: hypothetical protein KC994_11940 [Candidatus Omnitrophica bacterium]|nr:hypothetical protein [Candidatus Omnitrophota bacterium]
MEFLGKRSSIAVFALVAVVLLAIGYRFFTGGPPPPTRYSIQEIEIEGFHHVYPLFINNSNTLLIQATRTGSNDSEILSINSESNSVVETGLFRHSPSKGELGYWPKSFNDLGEIAGNVMEATGPTGEGFVWSAKRGLVVFSPQAGGRFDIDTINNRSEIAATIYTSATTTHACITSPSGEINTLGIATGSGVSALNNLGTVLGWKKDPFCWFVADEKGVNDLSMEGISMESAVLIRVNDLGNAIGNCQKSDSTVTTEGILSDGYPIEGFFGNQAEGFGRLKGISGMQNLPTDINNHDQVIGHAYDQDRLVGSGSLLLERMRMIIEGLREILVGHPIHRRSDLGDSVALTWIDGELYRLEDMVEDKGDWLWLIDAQSINDQGQIVGNGIRKDTPRGSFTPYLLTPVEKGD